ncbi:MAG: TVP38/TMEM64 family protein [Gammaproteobacteria bacterium]
MTIRNLFHKRIVLLGTIIILAALIVNVDVLYEISDEIIVFSEKIISQFPILGMLLFVILAIVSAMLAFYSSAILVPIGVYAWGTTTCFILLWVGWLIGGILSFSIGYYFGRPATSKLIGEKRYSNFEEQVSRRAKFIHILLFQAALPSEIPGYVLGTLHYRFIIYFIALAVTELPYALGTVYLGSSFLERNTMVFLALGVGAVLVSACLYYLYRQHIHKNRN